MTNTFTKDHKPRYAYDPNFNISDPQNSAYVKSLAKHLLTRMKSSAKAYHEKHKGVKDNGKSGKKVTIKLKQVEQKIRDTRGISPDGVKIYWGPVAYLQNPGRAIKLGLMTEEENSRKPSVDRIKSVIKEYSNTNVQITTKKYNLGKSSEAEAKSVNYIYPNAFIKIGGTEILLNNCSPDWLAQYTHSLSLVS